MGKPEQRLLELGIQLPQAPRPGGIYVPVAIVNNVAYVSGHLPYMGDGSLITGRVGDNLTLDDARIAARQVGLCMLATLKLQLGSLDRIKRLVKTLGMVNSTADFGRQPEVINSFSELMVEVFGEAAGLGARSAVGMILPRHAAVEIEAIFELV